MVSCCGALMVPKTMFASTLSRMETMVRMCESLSLANIVIRMKQTSWDDSPPHSSLYFLLSDVFQKEYIKWKQISKTESESIEINDLIPWDDSPPNLDRHTRRTPRRSLTKSTPKFHQNQSGVRKKSIIPINQMRMRTSSYSRFLDE